MVATESHVMNQSSNQADQAVKNSQLPSKTFSSSFFESESSTIFIKTVKSDVKEDRASIFRLYCIAGNNVEVEVPKMQSYSSNNCPAFAAAYMVDLCDQRFVFGALYVDSQESAKLSSLRFGDWCIAGLSAVSSQTYQVCRD